MSAEEDRLIALKAECLSVCGPHSESAAAAAERAEASPDERDQALAEQAQALANERAAHAAHAELLAEAYAAFAGRQVSNPATPGAVTQLEAEVVVQSSAEPITDEAIDAGLAAEAEAAAAAPEVPAPEGV